MIVESSPSMKKQAPTVSGIASEARRAAAASAMGRGARGQRPDFGICLGIGGMLRDQHGKPTHLGTVPISAAARHSGARSGASRLPRAAASGGSAGADSGCAIQLSMAR
jgi:hypothetical protein